MKFAALLVGLTAAAALLLGAAPPRPKRPALTYTLRRDAAASVVWLKWGVSGPGDSLVVDVDASGQASVHRKYTADSKVDSVSYPAPAPAGTLSGTVRATNWRRLLSASVQQGWSYTEPDVPPPPPTIDSVVVRPASATVAPGGTVQFTASDS